MRSSKAALWPLALAAVTVALLYAAMYRVQEAHNPGRDPDRWYHYALSREMAATGHLVRTLPQADDLELARVYTDKEFLFHVLTAAGYRVAQERGVNAVCRVLGLSFLLVLLFGCWQALRPRFGDQAAAPIAGALVVLGTLFIPYFSPRLAQLRPHLLAMTCATALALALVTRARHAWPAAFWAAAFALSYHAIFVPLTLLGLAGVAFARYRRAALFALGGLVVGIVLNPYFPGTLSLGFLHLKIALAGAGGAGVSESGAELLALSLTNYLGSFGCLILPTAGLATIALSRATGEARARLAFFSASAALFWLAALRSPRASEYAVGLTVLTAAFALVQAWPRKRRHGGLAWTLVAMAAAVPVWTALRHFTQPTDHTFELLSGSVFEALDAIPRDGRPLEHKVFNCSWNAGALIYGARPDLRFVDLLDPRFLLRDSPEKSAARDELLAGTGKPYEFIHDLFHADYVLCYRQELNNLLKRDSRFKLVYLARPRRIGAIQYSVPTAVYRVR